MTSRPHSALEFPQICHAGLCYLVENGSINLDSDTFRITSAIASILSAVQEGADIATADTCERLLRITYRMQQNQPQAVQAAFDGLDESLQKGLQAAMRDYSITRLNVVTP